MVESKTVTEFVETDRLNIVAAGYSAVHPGMFLVVVVKWQRQAVRDDGEPGREVCMGEDTTDHTVIGIIGLTPLNEDIRVLVCRVLVCRNLGERKAHTSIGPGIESPSDCVARSLGRDPARKGAEGVFEVAVGPGSGDLEVDRVHKIWESTAGRCNMLLGGRVQFAGLFELEELLEFLDGSAGGLVESVFGAGMLVFR